MKLSVSNSQISLDENAPPSSLDILNTSNSSNGSQPSIDTLDKLSEINSDELEDTVPLIEIPNDIRTEAGSNWRLKEAILNSFHFGTATIKANEFARSDSDLKTAEIVASKDHTLDSKKYRVKIHLGNINSEFLFSKSVNNFCLANYRRWLRSVTHYTATISGKRKFETLMGNPLIMDSTPDRSSKSRKLSSGKG